MKRLFAVTFLLVALCLSRSGEADQRFLVIVVDGLRPDYVTPEIMPNLSRFGEGGVTFENHHSIYPTVTRVNSASISTGTHPQGHGLMENTVYFPSVDPSRSLSTSDYRNLLRIEEAEGSLLTATTLGEVLDSKGLRLQAISSGSSGSAFLLNPTLVGGGVINVGMILPESRREKIEKLIGPAPKDSTPALARNAWVVDAYIQLALDDERPAVTLMWLTDPDHTAHAKGIGAPVTVEALKAVDTEIGRILDAHAQRGLGDVVNVIVTSDHGFSTHRGGYNPLSLLVKHDLRSKVRIAGSAIYVENHDPKLIEKIVRLLQAEPWAGPIVTRAETRGDALGWVEGTLSFDAIQWRHDRSGDIVVAPMWDDEVNEYGYAGGTNFPGTAGHGSTSPFDIHNTLIASGPAFQSGVRSNVPTANSDIAPTILHLLGIDAPVSMTGRPILEALASSASSPQVETHVYAAESHGYRVEMSESVVNGRRYFNHARASR